MPGFPREEINYKRIYKGLDLEKALDIEWPEVFYPTDVVAVDEDQETFVEEKRPSLDEYDEDFCISKEVDEGLFAKVFQLLDRNFLSYTFRRIDSLKHMRGKLPCDVCGRFATKDEQLLLTCQGCGISVHEECYGVVEAPGCAWLCKKCIFHFEDGGCKLCQRQDGIMKRTNTNEWIHVICALLTPDISFCNNNIRDPVDISELTAMEGTCSICCNLGYSLIRCSFEGCKTAYHASCCAELLYCDLGNGHTYCNAHDPLKKHKRILSRRNMLRFADSYPEMSSTALLRTPAKMAVPIRTRYHKIVHTKPFVIEDGIEQFKNSKASVNAIKRYWTKKRKALGFYFNDIFLFSNSLLNQK